MIDAGWHIDPRSLLPVIDDIEAFRRAHRDDEARDALEALWGGRPGEAEALLRAAAQPGSPRIRALIADAWRDQGRHDAAIRAYRELVQETAGTRLEATMRQHLGKTYFAAGRHAEALEAFTVALTLRVRDGADPDLIASSRLAVDRATERIADG